MPDPEIPKNLLDKIGYWSEIKLEILKKYSHAYSTILAKQPKLKHIYIDAFAGTGVHISRTTGEIIKGSPINALNVDPPFFEYHFIDKNPRKVKMLKSLAKGKNNVFPYEGDCNEILINQVFPQICYEDFKRGLCFLDPYGLHLDWKVVKKAGEMKTIDIFLNFPLYDMNLNVLLCDPKKAKPKEVERMNLFWGDNSWRQEIYNIQGDFFENDHEVKGDIRNLIKAFRKRLKQEGGFAEVPEPIPMKNEQGGTLYYLYFASQKKVAAKIARDLFKNYRVPGL